MSLSYRQACNVDDFRELARRRLPRTLFEFVDRGSENELALNNNKAAFQRRKFSPKVLVDVSQRSLASELFGKPLGMPVAIAPTGSAGLLWHEGELALARAAKVAGTPFTLATGSLTSLERVAREVGGRLWFQLYMWKDKELSYSLMQRAVDADYEALIVTVDAPVPSNREYNVRNGFTLPFKFNRDNVPGMITHPRWLLGVMGRYLIRGAPPRFENYPPHMQSSILSRRRMEWLSLRPDSLTWADLRELRDRWPGKLLVKGILRPDDAEQAINCGVDGIIVSNHGGRMLDTSVAPLDALPAIAARVARRVPLLLDSGISRGSDVVTAIALGASCTLVGRATLYGTAVAGEQGATKVLQWLRDEALTTMALIGRPTLPELGPDCFHA